ncbi:MAG: hypothetical protein QM778_04895 [Myxococcales bacterium]
MTHEPQRWLEDRASLDPDFAEAAVSFQRDAPSQAQLDRMLQRFAVPEPVPQVKLAPENLPMTVKWLGVTSLALLTGLGALWFWPSEAATPVPARAAPEQASPTAEAHAASLEHAAVPREEAPPAKVARKTRVLPARTVSQEATEENVLPAAEPRNSTSELELLQRARRVLGASPTRALELAEEHRAAFPRGLFAEERELLAIEALLALGRRGEGATRAAAFEGQYPRSIHAQRLRRLMAPEEKSELPSATGHSSQEKETTPQP